MPQVQVLYRPPEISGTYGINAASPFFFWLCQRKWLMLPLSSEGTVPNSQEPASGMEPASEKGKRFVFSLSCGDKTATPHDGAFLFQYHPQHVNKKPSPPLEGHTAVPPSPRQKGAPLRNGTSPAPFTANVPPHLALPNISPLHLHMENLNGRLENRPPIWACFLYPKNLGPKNGRLVPFHRLSLPCEGPRACRGFYVWPCHRI